MDERVNRANADGIEEISPKNRFGELYNELGQCSEAEQKQKTEEMDRVLKDMSTDDIFDVFKEERFEEMHRMIEEEKMKMEDCVRWLMGIGRRTALCGLWWINFKDSLLCKRFEKMIVKEDGRKEEKNEKLLIHLCECYLLLCYAYPKELLSICLRCVLKVASDKDSSCEALMEKDMAFTALGHVDEYHQEHRNMSSYGYQLAWGFLISRLRKNEKMEKVIVEELHFVRESRRELEELRKRMHMEKAGDRLKKTNEEEVIERWIKVIGDFFGYFRLKNEEYSELIGAVVGLCKGTRGDGSAIFMKGIARLANVACLEAVSVDYLAKGELLI
ncbi:uncharacterized protein MONOS_17897 [Monocercomonoides exilis]|uniref:uncharacterized protein n=1 Tax=Monocercomonoides exilis TaxID=2049356 RepID=UPI003559398D|nr:hypothetical protein MONOS_17897 [Monocercomonoides exilis]